MITLVVFSKDRAMQLDSLLRSVKDSCTGIDRVAVIANASSDLQTDAYIKLGNEQIDRDGWDLTMELGRPIGAIVADHVLRSNYIALAVDDQLFYRLSDFKKAANLLDLDDAFVWSWRLGFRKPGVEWDDEEHWYTSALSSDPDYGYLFHSDGAIYRTVDYTKMLDTWRPGWRTEPYTPNDLEAAVASRKPQWAASVGPHLGPIEPTCITWQINRVQTRYGSPAAEIPETNVDALAKAYLEGKRVDNEKLYAMLRDNPFHFNPPGARPTHVYASEDASKFWAGCIR